MLSPRSVLSGDETLGRGNAQSGEGGRFLFCGGGTHISKSNKCNIDGCRILGPAERWLVRRGGYKRRAYSARFLSRCVRLGRGGGGSTFAKST